MTEQLRIDSVAAGMAGGRIGMTRCPGQRGSSALGPGGHQDLHADIRAIADWGAGIVITLIEPGEMVLLGVAELGTEVAAAGMQWLHWPITDMSAPDERFAAGWAQAGASALEALQAGRHVLLHCRAGLGRTGTVAAFLLMQMKMPAEQAIQQVRAARPGAIETERQLQWLR
jgi:ADP-ribosyl-[dinitrogen reductase] hydrolase